MLGPAQNFATIQGNKALRVTTRIAFDSGQRMTTEAVVFVLDSGTEPYRVLTWRDDIDDARSAMTGLSDITAYVSRWLDALRARSSRRCRA